MTSEIARYLVLSLILQLLGCQTINTDRENTVNDERSNSLSVAAAFLEQGQPEKAISELKGLIIKDPNHAPTHNLMGIAHLAFKNPVKAVAHLETAWNLEKKTLYGLNLSSAYLEGKQYDKAQKIIESALKLKESPPYRNPERLYHNLGLIAEKKGKLAAAEKSYRKALEENPIFYLSRVRLALLLEEKKKPELAKLEWEQARYACPGCYEPTEKLAHYYRKKGDLRTALGVVQDYRRIEGIKLKDSQNAAILESEISAERLKSAKEVLQKSQNATR